MNGAAHQAASLAAARAAVVAAECDARRAARDQAAAEARLADARERLRRLAAGPPSADGRRPSPTPPGGWHDDGWSQVPAPHCPDWVLVTRRPTARP